MRKSCAQADNNPMKLRFIKSPVSHIAGHNNDSYRHNSGFSTHTYTQLPSVVTGRYSQPFSGFISVILNLYTLCTGLITTTTNKYISI